MYVLFILYYFSLSYSFQFTKIYDKFASLSYSTLRSAIQPSNTGSESGVNLRQTLVICGPSGVGKGTMISRLLISHSDKIALSVSHTSRAPRNGEIDGFHYHFVSKDQMIDMINDKNEKHFIESAEVHGNYYGTSYQAVLSIQQQNKLCLLDIDTKGVKHIKSTGTLPAYYIFIAPPSIEQLEERLRGRGTETPEQLAIRTKNARDEIEYGLNKGNFDKVIVNDDLESAISSLEMTIREKFPDYFNR
jgi:guanylate kinase